VQPTGLRRADIGKMARPRFDENDSQVPADKRFVSLKSRGREDRSHF
jgi:hypothetical protein